jgi:hypothetical protein
MVVSRVTLATERSPRAAARASAHVRSVPPTQKPSALMVLRSVMSLTTLMAVNTPCSR